MSSYMSSVCKGVLLYALETLVCGDNIHGA